MVRESPHDSPADIFVRAIPGPSREQWLAILESAAISYGWRESNRSLLRRLQLWLGFTRRPGEYHERVRARRIAFEEAHSSIAVSDLSIAMARVPLDGEELEHAWMLVLDAVRGLLALSKLRATDFKYLYEPFEVAIPVTTLGSR